MRTTAGTRTARRSSGRCRERGGTAAGGRKGRGSGGTVGTRPYRAAKPSLRRDEGWVLAWAGAAGGIACGVLALCIMYTV
eukprot:scaffold14649_cov124-Isochrysis_galbana.AAC.2